MQLIEWIYQAMIDPQIGGAYFSVVRPYGTDSKLIAMDLVRLDADGHLPTTIDTFLETFAEVNRTRDHHNYVKLMTPAGWQDHITRHANGAGGAWGAKANNRSMVYLFELPIPDHIDRLYSKPKKVRARAIPVPLPLLDAPIDGKPVLVPLDLDQATLKLIDDGVYAVASIAATAVEKALLCADPPAIQPYGKIPRDTRINLFVDYTVANGLRALANANAVRLRDVTLHILRNPEMWEN